MNKLAALAAGAFLLTATPALAVNLSNLEYSATATVKNGLWTYKGTLGFTAGHLNADTSCVILGSSGAPSTSGFVASFSFATLAQGQTPDTCPDWDTFRYYDGELNVYEFNNVYEDQTAGIDNFALGIQSLNNGAPNGQMESFAGGQTAWAPGTKTIQGFDTVETAY